jgi:hypothetical protein
MILLIRRGWVEEVKKRWAEAKHVQNMHQWSAIEYTMGQAPIRVFLLGLA